MIEVTVPDIGDFIDVEIVEVLVAEGDEVSAEDPLVVVESEKASMEVPSPVAGVVRELLVKVGDRVSAGSRLAPLEPAEGGAAAEADDAERAEVHAQVLVLGSGPGGYTAAFRAADLGLRRRPRGAPREAGRRLPERRLHPVEGAPARRPGGHRGAVAGRASGWAAPEFDIDGVREWKDGVVGKLTGGLDGHGEGAQGARRPR